MARSEPVTKLGGMQNSAASCSIVGVLCLATAVITGSFGVYYRQLSACMITGVMYSMAGVFQCFALIIMITKVGYQQEARCYLLEANKLDPDLCSARIVTTGWSMPIGWVSCSLSIIALGFWLLMARCFRLENAKSMI